MQWYRENAKYKERTHTFIERMGIERVRAVIVDDVDGIAADAWTPQWKLPLPLCGIPGKSGKNRKHRISSRHLSKQRD